MTLAGRNATTRTLLVGALLIVGSIFGWIVREGHLGIFIPALPDWPVVAAVSIAVVGIALALLHIRLFKRSPSLAMFFVTIFLESLVLDLFKLPLLVELSLTRNANALVLGRILLGGHTFSVLLLFAAGLYVSGVRFQRHGTVLLIALALSAALTINLPVDLTQLGKDLVFRPVLAGNLTTILYFLLAIAIVSYFQTAIREGDTRLVFSGFAVTFLAVGRELLFYAGSRIHIIVGVGLIIAGGVMNGRRNYRDFVVG